MWRFLCISESEGDAITISFTTLLPDIWMMRLWPHLLLCCFKKEPTVPSLGGVKKSERRWPLYNQLGLAVSGAGSRLSQDRRAQLWEQLRLALLHRGHTRSITLVRALAVPMLGPPPGPPRASDCSPALQESYLLQKMLTCAAAAPRKLWTKERCSCFQ